ncbi:MAG: hypothetical protein F6K19_22175 [Cyanothece sp. SIO1E1]|nr:hypothetical protein [Cyanothece sp. SIO1E1]
MEPTNNGMLEKIDVLLLEGNLKEAAELIKIAIQTGINLQGKHILYAHALLLCKDWLEISELLPRDTNSLATSGWLDSVYMGRPLNAEMQPIPWFTYAAIDYLDTLVQHDWKVFEWGAGNSTLWWASKVQLVNSIEDNENWVAELTLALPNNASVIYRGTKEDYIHAIDQFEPTFSRLGQKKNDFSIPL